MRTRFRLQRRRGPGLKRGEPTNLLDLAVEHKIVEKSGAWYSVGGERIGQGRENARLFLKEHPEMSGDLAKKILAKRGIVVAGEGAAEGA